MGEIWRDVKGYEGLYQVSNLGRVKSLERIDYANRSRKERILKTKTNSGYLRVTLFKEGKRKDFLVHRLAAENFLPNPNNYPEVNHKDENKLNNHLQNLEFCTRTYNINYGTRNERAGEKQKGKIISETARKKISEANSKPLLQIDPLTNKIIKEWESATEVEQQLGINQGNISKCCLGRYKTCGGFKWRLAT